MSPLDAARIAFAGTPEFAVPSLAALIESGATMIGVMTQPDRRSGRGRRLVESPVKRFAVGKDVPVWQPMALDDDARRGLPAVRPEILVVAAYGIILPRWMLDWPSIAAVNVHASLLPRWRGAAPIQRAILAGDTVTGISIMHMTPGLDCGPVYAQESIEIGETETAGELHDRLASLGAGLLIETLPGILAGRLEASEQDDRAATYAPKIEKHDALLDWHQSAHDIERRIRAYNPWPVAEARSADGIRLRIWQAEANGSGEVAQPGTVVAAGRGGVDVATSNGLLSLKLVQSPGGRVMSVAAYLAAHELEGVVFVGPD